MFGAIEFVEFTGVDLPQKAQSAWTAVMEDPKLGAKFTPLLYLGEQTTNGQNYCYIAERIVPYRDTGFQNIAFIKINDKGGKYTLAKEMTIV